MKRALGAVGALLLFLATGVGAQSSEFTLPTISGRHLMLNGNPYQLRALAYSPTPIGGDPAAGTATETLTDVRFVRRDGPLMRAAGIEAARIYGTMIVETSGNFFFGTNDTWIQALADEGIWLIAGSFVPGNLDFADEDTRQDVIDAHVAMVNEFGDNQNVLMWIIGNELNLHTAQFSEYYSLMNETAAAMKAAQGGGSGPGFGPYVCVVDADVAAGIAAGASLAPNVDIWGANVYRGSNFSNLPEQVEARTTKPVWLAEYGTDSWFFDPDDPPGAPHPVVQADFAQTLWHLVKANDDVFFGADLGFYSDEWWKSSLPGDPPTPFVHDFGGSFFGAAPDNHTTEEWLGIMAIAPGGTGEPDVMIPKDAYDRIRSMLIGGLTGPAPFEADFDLSTSNNYGGFTFGFYGGSEFQNDSLFPTMQDPRGASGEAGDNALRAAGILDAQNDFTFFGVVATLFGGDIFGQDFTQYTTLRFDARVGTPTAWDDWTVRLEDSDSFNGPEFQNKSLPLVPAPTTEYRTYTFPLTDFVTGGGQVVDLSLLSQVVFAPVLPGGASQPPAYEADLLIDNLRIFSPPALSVLPGSLVFSAEIIENEMALFNLGGAALTVSGLNLVGSGNEAFGIVEAPVLPLLLPRGDNLTLILESDPLAAGTGEVFLEIESNDPLRPTVVVPLTFARGVESGIVVR